MKRRKRTEAQPDRTGQELAILGGDLRCVLDARTGRIVELVHEPANDAFVSAQTPPAGLEVYDELDRRWYSDLHSESTIGEVVAGSGQVEFVKQFRGAPFALHCCWRADESGLHLQVDAALHPRAKMRSIRISLVLPVTPGLISWAPAHPPASDVTADPVRYCYLADEKGKARTGIPMLSLYHRRRGGLSIVMPLELPKVQLNMGVEPADPRPWYVPEHVPRINAGAYVDTPAPPEAAELGESLVIRFTEKHVGLRPAGPLRFALWLFGHEPHWRVGLGKVVERYIDYFEPHPDSRGIAGAGGGANPNVVDESSLKLQREFNVTHTWFHGHFEFHGEFLTDEAVGDPGYRWICEPYPDRFRDLGVERIRGQIGRLKAAGIGTFLYGFNMHCDPSIVDKRGLHADVARGEDGEIARAYHDQPVMFFHPDSSFGRQLLDQVDRMTRAYPEIIGLALDNWNYTGIDFGHDDGVTMLNNRPAASVNFSQQRMIEALSARMHASGRFICTNKGRTIESMRGVDFVLTESRGAETYATFAYMNLLRNIVPAEYGAAEDSRYAEDVLKYLLIWGGQMGSNERANAEQARAYQPLLALLRNRRWVFQADPLTLPADTDGQIFRIDDRSPVNAGAVMVTLVRAEVSWRDGSFREGLPLTVRLADADRFSQAEWLSVERSAQPAVAVGMKRRGKAIEIELPPLGSAGVLKLY